MNNEDLLEYNENLEENILRHSTLNEKSDIEKIRETTRYRKDINNLFDEKRGKKLKEEVEANKEIYESINTSSDLKKKAYDFLSEVIGVDLYKAENKRELKKAYSLVDIVKKNTKTIEKVLNGDEVYNPQSYNNEALISYLSSIDPRRKGLYFKYNESRDTAILLNNEEKEHQYYITEYEQKIDNIDSQIHKYGLNQIDKVKNLNKEKLSLIRKIESHKRTINDIETDLNKHIIKNKYYENKIFEFENALNRSRSLSNNLEFSLSIAGPDYMSPEGKILDNSIKNLSELQRINDKFKDFIEEYAVKKNSKTEKLYTRIDNSTKDSNGEETYEKILDKNKAFHNQSKANMKAMRDTYFKNLGY